MIEESDTSLSFEPSSEHSSRSSHWSSDSDADADAHVHVNANTHSDSVDPADNNCSRRNMKDKKKKKKKKNRATFCVTGASNHLMSNDNTLELSSFTRDVFHVDENYKCNPLRADELSHVSHTKAINSHLSHQSDKFNHSLDTHCDSSLAADAHVDTLTQVTLPVQVTLYENKLSQILSLDEVQPVQHHTHNEETVNETQDTVDPATVEHASHQTHEKKKRNKVKNKVSSSNSNNTLSSSPGEAVRINSHSST